MTRRDPNGRAYTSSERGPPDRARIGSLCATIHSGSQVKRMRMGEAADVAAGTASGNTGGVHGACSSHSAFSFRFLRSFLPCSLLVLFFAPPWRLMMIGLRLFKPLT
jgi:hypothetical protein